VTHVLVSVFQKAQWSVVEHVTEPFRFLTVKSSRHARLTTQIVNEKITGHKNRCSRVMVPKSSTEADQWPFKAHLFTDVSFCVHLNAFLTKRLHPKWGWHYVLEGGVSMFRMRKIIVS